MTQQSICLIPNCGRSAPASEAFCSVHRFPKPKRNIARTIAERLERVRDVAKEAVADIQSTTAMAAEIERLKGVAAKADHARTCYARALEKMRIALVNINDGLEDEGDRIYLGSTNHADDIRAAWQIADSLKWDELLEHTQPETPIADTNLKLQAELDQLRREKAEAVTLLGRSLAYLQSTLGVTQDIRTFIGQQEQRT